MILTGALKEASEYNQVILIQDLDYSRMGSPIKGYYNHWNTKLGHEQLTDPKHSWEHPAPIFKYPRAERLQITDHIRQLGGVPLLIMEPAETISDARSQSSASQVPFQ